MDSSRTEIGAPLDFSGLPLVMGIVNCNADSFFPPSRALAGAAAERALRMEGEGAGIIDLGAESTRPGAAYVSAEEELERLVPVVEEIRRRSPVPLSVDTRKAVVAAACLEAGADIINDISALEDDPGMGRLCGEKKAAVILMHKQGTPVDMQDDPRYGDAASEVAAYLRDAAERAIRQGVDRERIILDPGIGFGKRLEDNLDILIRLAEICGNDYPVLIGVSRKGFIGKLTGRPTEERLAGTLAVEAWCVLKGARILRVHDVRETADLVKVLWALTGKRRQEHEWN
ncbi:MAG: dihydropteroate synthase [Treponema sp.]|nr:dihydropteroate synthase [Treponema sp.]